jgi:hypothetical protein
MRWYVEITPAGKEGAPTHKLCLEAGHWQPALQQARRILGQDDKLAGVSVEFQDDGCRATDGALSLLYVVSKAPDDAPVVEDTAEGDKPAGRRSKKRLSRASNRARASRRGKKTANDTSAETPLSKEDAEAVTGQTDTDGTDTDGTDTDGTDTDGTDTDAADAARKPPGKTVLMGSNAKSKRVGAQTMAQGSLAEVMSAEQDEDAEAEEAAAKKAEEAAAKKADEEAAAKKAEEEAAAKKAEEAAAKKKADEEAAAKKAEEEAAAAKKAEEEAAAAKKAEEEAAAAKKAEEAAAKKKAADEAKARQARADALGATLLGDREVGPTKDNPLRFNEETWFVKLPAPLEELSAFMEDRIASVASEDGGQVLAVGLYDHRFDDQPQRPPIASLRWRDWHEGVEQVFFPYSTKPATSLDEAVEVLGSDVVSAKSMPPDAAEEKRKAEEAAAEAKRKAEEAAAKKKAAQEAAAQKKADDAAAKKKADGDAAAKKKADGDAAAKKKADGDAAAKKKADGDAAAKKKAEHDPAGNDADAPPTTKVRGSTSAGRKKAAQTMIGGSNAPLATAATAAKVAAKKKSAAAKSDGGDSSSKDAASAKAGSSKARGSRRALGDRKKSSRKSKAPASSTKSTMKSEAPAPSTGSAKPKVRVEEARTSDAGKNSARISLGGTRRSAAPPAPEFDEVDIPTREERDNMMSAARERIEALAPPQSLPGNRIAGEDLLTDLFEDVAELHYLNDALEGAEFVLNLALEKLPCEAGLISLYDIDKREYVVVRQAGGDRSVVLLRLPEKAPIPRRAMRSTRAVVLPSVKDGDLGPDVRWEKMGVDLRSLICAPVEKAGRYLGLLELANPHDGEAFSDGDGHAMSYIGSAFGEFLAERGVMLDPNAVVAKVEAAAR